MVSVSSSLKWGSTSEYLLPAAVPRLGGGQARKHCRAVPTSGPAEFSLAWDDGERPGPRLRSPDSCPLLSPGHFRLPSF